MSVVVSSARVPSLVQLGDGVALGAGPPGKVGTAALACSVVLRVVGTPLLGITAQMQRGGWLVTPLLLVAGSAIIGEMTWLVSSTVDLLQRERGVEVESYQDFAEAALGRGGRAVSSLTSTLALIGMICTGHVLTSNNLQYMMPLPWGLPGCTDHCGRKWWAILMTAPTLLYAFVDVGSALSRSAVLGFVVCAGCVLLAWAGCGAAVAELDSFPLACSTDAGRPYWSWAPEFDASDWREAVLGVASVSSYGFYCYAIIETVPSVKRHVAEPAEFVPASIFAYSLCTVLYLAVMTFGYYGFGNLGPDSIISGMTKNRPEKWWAMTKPWETGEGSAMGNAFAWMITLNMLMTDAIYVPCTVLAIEGWAPGLFSDPEHGRAAKVVVRVFLAAFRTLVATGVSQFLALTNLTSSLFCVCNNILIPIVAFHRVRAVRVTRRRKATHAVMFAFGLFVLVCGTWSAVRDILHPSEAVLADPGVFPREDISDECRRIAGVAAAAPGTGG